MTPSWIAVDWGTSCLRAWAISGSGEILDRLSSDEGMGGLNRNEFEPILMRLLEPWLGDDQRMPVFACGMVGSKQGWVEVPYASLPWRPAENSCSVVSENDQVTLHICPGLMQASPADIMRGEETQISGLLVTQPDFEGVVCLPGTHSKWAVIRDGSVQSFRTFMTGELYLLLSKQSVLRHSMSGADWDDDEFLHWVGRAMEIPGNFSSELFSIRSESILQNLSGEKAKARLSGLLAGLEMHCTRDLWQESTVALIGETELSEKYRLALGANGAKPEVYCAEEMTVNGLGCAFRNRRE